MQGFTRTTGEMKTKYPGNTGEDGFVYAYIIVKNLLQKAYRGKKID